MSSVLVMPVGGLGTRFKGSIYGDIKPFINIYGTQMAIASLKCFQDIADTIIVGIRTELASGLKVPPEFSTLKTHYIDKVTKGPAITILDCLNSWLVEDNEELYTINCDQIIDWDPKVFKHFCSQDCDGTIVTFEGGDSRHSFVSFDRKGRPYSLAEKIKISNTALTGIHYWKSVGYYRECVKRMIKDNLVAPNGEFYVSLAYNYMLKDNKKLLTYHIPKDIFHPVGTPEELAEYFKW